MCRMELAIYSKVAFVVSVAADESNFNYGKNLEMCIGNRTTSKIV